jgi:hypothetical protein
MGTTRVVGKVGVYGAHLVRGRAEDVREAATGGKHGAYNLMRIVGNATTR